MLSVTMIALYTTHSSTAGESPRPSWYSHDQGCAPEEFVAVSRYLAQMLGIDY